MAIRHRKQLGIVIRCPDCAYSAPAPDDQYPPPPPPPPPPFKKPHHFSPTFIVLIGVFGSAILLVSFLVFLKIYYSKNSRRRNQAMFDDDDHEDFVDENHGPIIDHPIWYINTIGLQQSVIDSIAVFKYKKDQGLIVGTDCSVCLSEFQEDETLRLLPKCSHAFHIPCIDAWLRSHQNCPLCRAPIVTDGNRVDPSESDPNLNNLGGPREANPVENLENFDQESSEISVETENFGGLPSEERTVSEIITKDSLFFNMNNFDSRVLSDLADHRATVENELQPVRRSISMDELSASKIYVAVANIPQVGLEGCSSTRSVQLKKPNSDKVVSKGVNKNSSMSRLKKSCSVDCSLQMGHVAMKRSFSSGGKFDSPRRYTRSQDSMIPLLVLEELIWEDGSRNCKMVRVCVQGFVLYPQQGTGQLGFSLNYGQF
ncbi:unnamed protein product [Camellia sinensis]